VLLTLLNCIKPLHIDDVFYYSYAAHISEHPLDPYGFSLMIFDRPEPANEILAPPVFLYWWAAAIALFGDHPFLWKLWLFPFALILVYSLRGLCRRFAPALATPLSWMLVLSPAILPGYNLMLDVPALALGLAAVILFIRGCDDGSVLSAIGAGLVAALAMQTKYTGFLSLGTMFLYAAGQKRWGLLLLAACLAIMPFAVWEVFVAARYGVSHFLFHLWQQGEIRSPPGAKLRFVLPLFMLLGGLASVLLPMALIALQAPRRWVLAATVIGATNYALVAVVPQRFIVLLVARADSPRDGITLNDAVFGCVGLAVLVLTAVAGWRMSRNRGSRLARTAALGARPGGWFLLSWLCLEVAGYFVLSPYPAARRVMGIFVVSTLIICRLALENPLPPLRLRGMHALALGSVVLGLGFCSVDWCEAFAEKQAAEQAARHIRAQDAGATIWYTGFWGFEFYADRAGSKQLIPMTPRLPRFSRSGSHLKFSPPGAHIKPVAIPEPSLLRKDDWLVFADPRIAQQPVAVDRAKIEFTQTLLTQDLVPLRTVMCYYRGHTPLQHHEGPRVVVQIARVTKDFVPASR
jgi:hypothetical protein